MHLRALVPLLLTVTLLAGCGSDSDTSSGGTETTPKRAGGPLAEVLSYFSPRSAFVLTVPSDPDDARVRRTVGLVRRFPGGAEFLAQLERDATAAGVDLRKDVFPALGNEVAFGNETTDDDTFLLVARAPDAEAVSRLLRKADTTGPARTVAGAQVSDFGDGDLIATDGATVLLGNEPVVLRALALHEAGGGLTAEVFERNTRGLGDAARLFGDAARLLQDPSAAQARRVPWVAALRTFGAGLTVLDDRVSLRFRLDTTGRRLTAAQLPWAAGDRVPGLLPGRALRVGLSDLAKSFDFDLAVAEVVAPGDLTEFRSALSVLKAATGVDLLEDFAGVLGDATVSTDLRTFVFRAAVDDPDALADVLTRLRPFAPAGLSGAGLGDVDVTGGGGGLFAVSRGDRVIGGFGVVDGVFVAGNAPAQELRDAARADLVRPQDADGTLAGEMDAGLLRRLLDAELPVPGLTAPLGDVSGWARVEPDALTAGVTARIAGG